MCSVLGEKAGPLWLLSETSLLFWGSQPCRGLAVGTRALTFLFEIIIDPQEAAQSVLEATLPLAADSQGV